MEDPSGYHCTQLSVGNSNQTGISDERVAFFQENKAIVLATGSQLQYQHYQKKKTPQQQKWFFWGTAAVKLAEVGFDSPEVNNQHPLQIQKQVL